MMELQVTVAAGVTRRKSQTIQGDKSASRLMSPQHITTRLAKLLPLPSDGRGPG